MLFSVFILSVLAYIVNANKVTTTVVMEIEKGGVPLGEIKYVIL